VITVKGNQPGLYAQLAALPWRDVPVAYINREQGHGRIERRTLKVRLPWRRLPERRFPAGPWLPGQIPVPEARCAASGKNSVTSAPISEMTAAAASGADAGDRVSRSRWARRVLSPPRPGRPAP
jgi:hypothetical protein